MWARLRASGLCGSNGFRFKWVCYVCLRFLVTNDCNRGYRLLQILGFYFKSVTLNPLLQILDALLAGNSFLWTLPGAGIGAGALTTHGQAAAMPQTAVATNILKT